MRENIEYDTTIYDENMCWKIFDKKHRDSNEINGERKTDAGEN